MPPTDKPSLKIFLSYASQDALVVQELSRRLASEGWIDPWVDKKKLLPGQDWRTKIEEAVETSDVVLICLSTNSVSKEGFVQKELRYAREIAFEKPEETIFLIPLRLDDCTVPRGLRFYQWGDYFGENKDDTYNALLESLKLRHEQKLSLEAEERARQEKVGKEREAAEKAVREKAEREAVERAALEKAERETAGKAARERAEREAVEKAAREKANREAAEKAKRKKAERRATRNAELKRNIFELFTTIRLTLVKTIPFLRVVGIIGIVIVLFWIGTWATPKFVSLMPTPKLTTYPTIVLASSTNTLSAQAPISAFTALPPSETSQPRFTPSDTPQPNTTSTQSFAPVASPQVYDSHPMADDYHDALGVPMRLVPPGNFTMGSNNGPSDAQPAHTVYLDAFYMDKYLVTNVLYQACVSVGTCQPPYFSPYANDSPTRIHYYGNAQYDNYPVTKVSWYMAQAYCEWRGALLPTEAQWEKAARGTDGRTYPWGEYIDRTYANYNGSDTTAVDIYEKGKSPYGIYDMAGNVWEWVVDFYSAIYYKNSPLSNPLGLLNSGVVSVLRGGAWNTIDVNSLRTFTRNSEIPDRNFYPWIGFRCARSAP